MCNDSFMLLCYLNTKLRDQYKSLDDLCDDLNLDKEEVINKLKCINYALMIHSILNLNC